MNVKDEWSMACPKCGDDSELIIQALIDVRLTVDGTEDVAHGHVWDSESICSCGKCGHTATVGDFVYYGDVEREKAQ
jgi:ribosomal protein S27AE